MLITWWKVEEQYKKKNEPVILLIPRAREEFRGKLFKNAAEESVREKENLPLQMEGKSTYRKIK